MKVREILAAVRLDAPFKVLRVGNSSCDGEGNHTIIHYDADGRITKHTVNGVSVLEPKP